MYKEAEFLNGSVKNAIHDHAMSSDREICGIIKRVKKQFLYERCENIHPNPEEHVRFSKAVYLRIANDSSVVAFVHSHPQGPIEPSKQDMIMQAALKKPAVIWARDPASGIVQLFSFGDHLLDEPLIGRMFHYGVMDCYEAIRSFYWQTFKLYLDPYPRTDWWWDNELADEVESEDRDMYMKYFMDQGFEPYTANFSDPLHPNAPQFGDLILMQVGSNVVNHGGVYVGNNEVYHHRMGRRSSKHPIGYFTDKNYVRVWARHKTMKAKAQL
jgi:proteasome lid subunit RPN8/RPN11